MSLSISHLLLLTSHGPPGALSAQEALEHPSRRAPCLFRLIRILSSPANPNCAESVPMPKGKGT